MPATIRSRLVGLFASTLVGLTTTPPAIAKSPELQAALPGSFSDGHRPQGDTGCEDSVASWRENPGDALIYCDPRAADRRVIRLTGDAN